MLVGNGSREFKKDVNVNFDHSDVLDVILSRNS